MLGVTESAISKTCQETRRSASFLDFADELARDELLTVDVVVDVDVAAGLGLDLVDLAGGCLTAKRSVCSDG